MGEKIVLLTSQEIREWRDYGQDYEGYLGFHLSLKSVKGTKNLPVKAFRHPPYPRYILRSHGERVAKLGTEHRSLKSVATVLDKMPCFSFSSMFESRIWHNRQQKWAPLTQPPCQNSNAFPGSEGFYSYFSPVRALFPVLESPLLLFIEAMQNKVLA